VGVGQVVNWDATVAGMLGVSVGRDHGMVGGSAAS
jgi:hypothetical protein